MDKNLRLQVILSAVDRLLKPLEGNSRASKKLTAALREQQIKLKELKAAAGDVAAWREQNAALMQNRAAMEAAQKKAQDLSRAHAAGEGVSRKATAAMNRARAEVTRLKAEEEKRIRSLREIRTRLDAAGVSTKSLSSDELHLRTSIERTTASIEEQKRALADLARRQERMARARAGIDRASGRAGQLAGAGAGAIAAGTAAGAPVVAAGRASIDFERAMASVRKVVDFDTPDGLQNMTRAILDLSGQIPVARGELAELVAQGARSGIKGQAQLLAYAEAAAKMGVAFDVSSEEAGQMMATWRTALDLDHDEVIALANQVNYLTNSYGGNAAAVSEMITRVGPLADVAGAGSATLAALAQVMNSVGVESEVGATGIKNMLLGLTRGTAATRKQKEAFAALGLDAGRVAEQMQTDAQGAITGVLQAISRLPESQRLSVLGQLFGTESVAAIAPMLSQLDLVERNLTQVGDATNYANSMQREFAGTTDNTASRMDVAGNKVMRMATILGDKVKPFADMAANAVGRVADAVSGFADRHPALAAAAMIVLGVISGLLIAVGGLMLVISAVLVPIAVMRGSMILAGPVLKTFALGMWGAARAAAAAAISFIAATWPILLVIAAIALLAAGVYLIYRNWGAISAWFAGVWERIKEFCGAALEWIVQAFMNFHPLGLLIQGFAAVWPWLAGLSTRFAELGRNLIQGLISGITGMLGRLRSTITDAASSAADWFKRKLGIHSPSRVFAAFGGHTMEGLALGIERSRNRPIDAVAGVGAALTGALALGASPAAAGSPSGYGAGAAPVHYELNIYAQPGQDLQQLADEIMRRLEAKQRDQQNRRFDDGDD